MIKFCCWMQRSLIWWSCTSRNEMSGSETGVLTSREPFNAGLQKSPAPSQPVLQNMCLAYSADGRTAEYKPLTATSPPTFHSSTAVTGTIVNGTDSGHGGDALGINFNMGSKPLKRKRGRPRKYGPDGAMALGSEPKPSTVTVNQSSGGFASPTSLKKVRGRPPGSSKKQQLELLGNFFSPRFTWTYIILILGFISFVLYSAVLLVRL